MKGNKKVKIFAIADLHLSFNNGINKPMDDFGDEWIDHANRLRDHWDELVSEEDILLLPGDLSWALKPADAVEDLDWIHERPGKKLLLKGNHDLWWSSIKKLNAMYEDMRFIQNDCYYINEIDTAVAGTRGWIMPGTEGFDDSDEKIYRRELLRLEMSLSAAASTGAEKIVAMTHYPPAYENSDGSAFTDLLESYGVSKCVYGHLHGANVWLKGIRGERKGIDYKLVALDFLGAKPKMIFDGTRWL